MIAVNFVFWAVDNAIGPQIRRAADISRYFHALVTVLGCFVLLEVVVLSRWTGFVVENRWREGKIKQGEAAVYASSTHSFENVTNRE